MPNARRLIVLGRNRNYAIPFRHDYRFTETSLKLQFKQTPSPVFRKIKQYLIKNFDGNFNTLVWLIIALQNTNFNTGTQTTKTNTSKIVFFFKKKTIT